MEGKVWKSWMKNGFEKKKLDKDAITAQPDVSYI